jgi:hypothetical protein
MIRFCYQVVDAFLVADAELTVEEPNHFFGARVCGLEQGLFKHIAKVRQQCTLSK